MSTTLDIRRRGAAALLFLAATLTAVGCGGGGGGDLTGPPPAGGGDGGGNGGGSGGGSGSGNGGGGSGGGVTEGPPPIGLTVYAVDLANRLLVFGSESPTTVSRMVKITGVPILYRIVGIDFRASDGKLYGVGNDSRVYTLDTHTGVATPVSATQFTPKIAAFFDIHFGMGFEPGTERIRLIAAESGGNWSINPNDGTAVLDANVHYAAGDVNEGHKPRILGLAYDPPSGSAVSASFAQLTADGPCEKLMYAIDADLAEMIGSCNPKDGDFTSIGPIPGLTAIARCGELKFDHGPGNLWLTIQKGAQELNSYGSVDPKTGAIHWVGDVPDDSPIQAIAFAPDGSASASVAGRPDFRSAVMSASASTADVAASSDGVPCPGT